MTMVPAQSLSKQQQHQLCDGGYFGEDVHTFKEGFGLMSRLEGYEYSCVSEACLLGSDLVVANIPMAEDESRTNSFNNEAGSSSKDVQEERHEGWLQLSIGGHTTTATPTSHEGKHDHHHHHQQQQQQQQQLVLDSTSRRGGLIELDLLRGSSSRISHQARPLSSPVFHVPDFRAPPRPVPSHATNFSNTSLFFQHHPAATSSTYPLHQEINWPFRPMLHNIATASSSPPSSSSSLMPLGSYFSRPFQVNSTGMDFAGPSSDFKVIDPPRRSHSGIWFMLQASQNQTKEPFLPQISKSYLRIKDGRMTVRLLMKYLVNKLRLDSESEQIEMTCRGQQLLPFLTLQHVRDNIWSPREALTLLPESSTTDHVMVLHYGRSA
ncbi:protein LAX PANICLE 2-like isoform X1 [Populus nigra]|uniref:protein LAX PANICLE 2-like isoform X1 n=1 Tax=Populus nigra TaxID=3691 RepID=UPI002B26A19C|nr:protein LAX PANICLE 2-like isoform X1 [Populus nigra]